MPRPGDQNDDDLVDGDDLNIVLKNFVSNDENSIEELKLVIENWRQGYLHTSDNPQYTIFTSTLNKHSEVLINGNLDYNGDYNINDPYNTTNSDGNTWQISGEIPPLLSTGLKVVSVGTSVTSISDECFIDASNLDTISFNETSTCTKIGVSALKNTDIFQITIPSSVTRIDGRAFENCSSLTEVLYDSNPQLQTIGYSSDVSADNNKRAFANSGLVSILIPSSVTIIGEECFDSCSSLQTVTFADDSNLTTLKKSAFQSIVIRANGRF